MELRAVKLEVREDRSDWEFYVEHSVQIRQVRRQVYDQFWIPVSGRAWGQVWRCVEETIRNGA